MHLLLRPHQSGDKTTDKQQAEPPGVWRDRGPPARERAEKSPWVGRTGRRREAARSPSYSEGDRGFRSCRQVRTLVCWEPDFHGDGLTCPELQDWKGGAPGTHGGGMEVSGLRARAEGWPSPGRSAGGIR